CRAGALSGSRRARHARRSGRALRHRRRGAALREAAALRRGAASGRAAFVAGLDAEPIVDLLHAGAVLDEVLRHALHPAVRDRALERRLTRHDRDGDLGRIDVAVLLETVADLLLDAVVGA